MILGTIRVRRKSKTTAEPSHMAQNLVSVKNFNQKYLLSLKIKES